MTRKLDHYYHGDPDHQVRVRQASEGLRVALGPGLATFVGATAMVLWGGLVILIGPANPQMAAILGISGTWLVVFIGLFLRALGNNEFNLADPEGAVIGIVLATLCVLWLFLLVITSEMKPKQPHALLEHIATTMAFLPILIPMLIVFFAITFFPIVAIASDIMNFLQRRIRP